MKEHEDDVIPGVEKSTVSVDFHAVEIVTEKFGGGEGVLTERDEGEDMMVDVVGAYHGGAGVKVGSDGLVEEKETETNDLAVEEVADSCENVCHVSVGSSVVNVEKVEVIMNDDASRTSVEVSKDVLQHNVVTTVASKSDGDCKVAFESLRGEPQVDVIDSNELTTREEVMERHVEHVEDCMIDKKTRKETEILDSSKIAESPVTTVNLDSPVDNRVIIEDGFSIKGDDKDSVSVDPSLACANNQSSSTEVVSAGTVEVEERSREESLHPTTEVITDDAKGKGTVESLSSEPRFVEVKNALIDREVESERGLSEEVMEQPMDCEPEMADGDPVVNEQVGKEYEALDSSKISEPSTTTNSGYEDLNVVVVEEGLACKDETQHGVSVEPSLSTAVLNSATGEGDVNVQAENRDEQPEVDKFSKKESLHSTIEVTIDDDEKPENGTGVMDSKLADESSSGGPEIGREAAVIDEEKTERGLDKDKELMEPPTESVEEVAYDKKGRKGDGVSKIPEALTKASLGQEDVLTNESESQDGDSVDPRLVCLVHVNAENSDQHASHGSSNHMFEKGLKAEAVNRDSIVNASASGKPSNDELLCNSGVEFPAIKISNSEVEVPNTGKMNGVQVYGDGFKEVSGVTPVADVAQHCVLPENSEFSYEDAHMEKGDDVGMDIDEVLSWKDEMPGIEVINGNPEKVQHSTKETPEVDVEQGQPIVYDNLNGSKALSEDENLKVETDSEEDDESVQEENQKVVEQSTCIEDVTNESSFSFCQSCYFRPPENEGQFSVSDLVWGKVRSHPWWPGQIIDPSDASQKAMKYHKKNCFLVAYFGDGSFAWNDSTVLKPFRANFSQIEKHTSSEAFENAVSYALEEVSRRVELGLSCSCVPQDIYNKIKHQVIENGGIRKEACRRYGTDESTGVSSFEPDKLVDYVRSLARCPNEGDRMELLMAKAQLSSYGHYKRHRQLTEYQFFGGDLLEETPTIPGEHDDSKKFANNLVKSAYPYKERSLSDDAPDCAITTNLASSSSSKKRKVLDSISEGSVKRPNLYKTSTALISTPKPSFKVGALIQRVASQLTGPPSVLKSNGDTKVEHGQHVDQDQLVGSAVSLQNRENSEKQTSVAEMLSQLHLAAQDPMKGYTFLNTIIPFFKSLRPETSSAGKPVTPKKRKASAENDPEEFEFDDVNDSYWTDRIIQNHSEEQLMQDSQNGGTEYHQLVAYEPDKQVKARRRKNKKQFSISNDNHEIEVKDQQSQIAEQRQKNLATEVVLKFTEGICFPSEIHLNKMFRRFGPLMESETEVDRQSGRARVVFKKCNDAEVAHNSAGKFNIFGSISVNYELNYTPLVSYKPLPLSIEQEPMDAS